MPRSRPRRSSRRHNFLQAEGLESRELLSTARPWESLRTPRAAEASWLAKVTENPHLVHLAGHGHLGVTGVSPTSHAARTVGHAEKKVRHAGHPVTPAVHKFHPLFALAPAAQPFGSSPTPGAYSPTQIRQAYGFDKVANVSYTGSTLPLPGAGQTIAIVDAYDNP